MSADQPGAPAGDPRTADVYTVLDDLADMVEGARSMPMSELAVIHRNDVLNLLDDLREKLPMAVQEAEELLADRVGVVEEGYREAERVMGEATAQAHGIVVEATDEAELRLAEATEQAHELIARAQAEHAHLVGAQEVTRSAIAQAEAMLANAQDDSDRMRVEVDQYVEDRFAAFEESLAKTLATVQRGRDRIRERYSPTDR